jgi:glutamine amidotransferase
MRVAILDYQAGNLASLQAGLRAVGATPTVTSTPAELAQTDRIVVPGVGHFSATSALNNNGLSAAMRGAVESGIPILGICLGMQWLFEGSEEAPGIRGLSLFPGCSRRFPLGVKTPHVGWNEVVRKASTSRLLCGFPDAVFAYFTHSYRIPASDAAVAVSDYAGEFTAVVEHGSIFGVQFHPEKSGAAGLKLLQNFCALSC